MGSFWKKTKEVVSLEAVISGAALDHILTAALPVFLFGPFAFSLIMKSGPRLEEAELVTKFVEYVSATPAIFGWGIVLGCITIIFGGYLAAHLAKKSELLNGFLVGIVILVGAGIEYLVYSNDHWYAQYSSQLDLVGFSNPVMIAILNTATPLLSLGGAYLYVWLKRKGITPHKPKIFATVGLEPIFEGRMGRWNFFVSVVALLIFYIVGVVASITVLGLLREVIGMLAVILGVIFLFALTVGLVIMSYSLTVRRLHDIELTGWLGLLGHIKFVGLVFGLFLFFWPSTKGENKYGETHDIFSLKYVFKGKEN